MIVVTVLACIVIILFAVAIALSVSKKSSTVITPPVSIGEWQVSQGSNPDKNTCQLYTFSTVMSRGIVIPPNPNLQPSTLDNMIGIVPTPSCTDGNNIIAKQMKRTCQPGQGPNSSTPPTCVTFDGQHVGEGYVEEYYESCVNKACPGEIAFVTIGDGGWCLGTDGNNNLLMSTCQPTGSDQQFKVTRKTPTSTASLTNGGGMSGLYGQIKHVTSGLCLTASQDQSSASCVDGNGINGGKTVLEPCNDGYNWLLIPSLTYCPYDNKGPNDLCCSGTKNCNNGVPTNDKPPTQSCCTNTPQQFVYGPSVLTDGKLIVPCGDSSFTYQDLNLNNYSQVKCLVDYLVGQGKSLAYPDKINNSPPLAINYVSSSTGCSGQSVTTNYVGLSAYNFNANSKLCQQSPASCIPL